MHKHTLLYIQKQEDPTRWGRHRLWGAVGYGIAVLLIGIMIDNHGFTPMYMAHVALVTSGVLLVRARLPMGRRRADASAANLKQQSHTKLSASVVWSILFSSVQRCVFFTVVLLCGVGSGVIENFLFLFLRQELHASSGIMGLGRLVTCGSEVSTLSFHFRSHAAQALSSYALAVYWMSYSCWF